MLHVIGVDLRGVQSLTLKAIAKLKSCQKIYLEAFTFIIQNSKAESVDLSKELDLLLRNNAEYFKLVNDTNTYKNEIVQSAKNGYETALVVLFDPLTFSNHNDVLLHAVRENIKYSITHNTSIQTCIGRCGLTLVAFDTVTIPFCNNKTISKHFIPDIRCNLESGLHTFCRLDLELENQTDDSLSPIFNIMTCATAARQLIDGYENVEGLSEDTLCVGMSRLGCESERIFVGTLAQMTNSDIVLGGSLHALVIVAKCHELEMSFLDQFAKIDSVILENDHIEIANDNVLHLIGLGLGGVDDLALEAFTCLKTCQKIYLETYTSVVLNAEGRFTDIVADLKKLLCSDAEYVTADREMVECGTEIVSSAKSGSKTAFLVVGDPLSSATHTDLIIRALEEKVSYKIINNTSIMTAVCCSGLRLHNFCQTVSIPYWDDSGRQTSIIDKIEYNLRRGKHTISLLDIKVKERSIENILRDRKVYEPPRFMTCATAAEQLMECLGDPDLCLSKDTLCVGMARVGCNTERIFCGSLEQVAQLSQDKLGGPLHSLVIAGICEEQELAYLSHAANIEYDSLRDLYKKHVATLHV